MTDPTDQLAGGLAPMLPIPDPILTTVDVTVLDLPSEVSADEVEARLTAFLKRLRERPLLEARLEKLRIDARKGEESLKKMGSPDGFFRAMSINSARTRLDRKLAEIRRVEGMLKRRYPLTYTDRSRISKRAKAVSMRRRAYLHNALGNLGNMWSTSESLKTQVLRLAGRVPAVVVADEAQADVIAAELHGGMPWMAPATDACWRALRRSARTGSPIRIGPLLLDGPPGVGKTSWAHRLASVLRIPSVEIDVSKGLASFSLAGIERGWSAAQPGRPLEAMMQNRLANPMVIVDEVDKAGARQRETGENVALQPALLGLIEPETARAWDCPFHRLRFDMSHLSWVLTSNDRNLVPAPVLSRMQVVSIPYPTVGELRDFAGRRAMEAGLPAPAAEALVEAVDWAGPRWQLSLRDVNRMLRRAEDLASIPTVH